MISDKVYKLCTSKQSVSSLLAEDPTIAPGDAWKRLYGSGEAGKKESKSTAREHRDKHTPEDLVRAKACGNWGPTEPSELFLRVCTYFCCVIYEKKYLTDSGVFRCTTMPSALSTTMFNLPWSVRHSWAAAESYHFQSSASFPRS